MADGRYSNIRIPAIFR